MTAPAACSGDLLAAAAPQFTREGPWQPTRSCIVSAYPGGAIVAYPEIYADAGRALAAAEHRSSREPTAEHFVASATVREIHVKHLSGEVVASGVRDSTPVTETGGATPNTQQTTGG